MAINKKCGGPINKNTADLIFELKQQGGQSTGANSFDVIDAGSSADPFSLYTTYPIYGLLPTSTGPSEFTDEMGKALKQALDDDAQFFCMGGGAFQIGGATIHPVEISFDYNEKDRTRIVAVHFVNETYDIDIAWEAGNDEPYDFYSFRFNDGEISYESVEINTDH